MIDGLYLNPKLKPRDQATKRPLTTTKVAAAKKNSNQRFSHH
jgi:hypothetical protein